MVSIVKSRELACQSDYVRMPDGVRLAVTTWLPTNQTKHSDKKRPALLITTRYWRAMEFRSDQPDMQPTYPAAVYYLSQGYTLVIADARGSGASFGYRETEMSSIEIDDIGGLIEWVAQQSWCDGWVATIGTSYTANTSLYSLVTGSKALKCSVCRAPDFDGYRYLLAPGGVINRWFIEIWGETTAAQDSNNVKRLFEGGYWPEPEEGTNNLLGVRPVDSDTDSTLLQSAITEHKANFNLAVNVDDLTFIDNKSFGDYRYLFESPYREKIEKSNIPMVIRCGWHDAGTQLGALSMFASFDCPIHIILGPWNHGGDFRADPFQAGSEHDADAIPIEEVWELTVQSLNAIFKVGSHNSAEYPMQTCSSKEQLRIVEYYTLGENRWKTTRQWPLPQTIHQRLYLAAEHQLCGNEPTSIDGRDCYQVDPTAGTGLNNRWHAQTAEKPILFPDRREEDKKLLIYDSQPIETDVEITGHPFVYLWIRSTATDGQFFAYLEMIDPDGRVRMLTEGQLRALHRKVCDEPPPYKMFGPYHSLKEKDAEPLVPGEVTVITFELYPISVRLKKGQRIRLAIAGADKDVFSSIEDCESPEIIVERNRQYSSYVSLPIVQ